MAKITLDSVISGFKSVTRLVSNFSKIEDSLNNDVLWRDNPEGEPNQMEDDLDMNTNRITNLPSPVNDTDAVRWVDVKDGVSGVNEVVPSQSGNEKVALTTNGTSLVFGAVDSDNVDFLQAGTGAVATDVQSKLMESVSVKDFGAVGDGVTDDTAAIQAALDSGAGSVYFPVGSYITSTSTLSHTTNNWYLTLRVPANTRLFGEGELVSSAVFANRTQILSITGSNVEIDGLTFTNTANDATQPWSIAVGFATGRDDSIVVADFSNLRIKNCTFNRNFYAVSVDFDPSNSAATFSDAVVESCTAIGHPYNIPNVAGTGSFDYHYTSNCSYFNNHCFGSTFASAYNMVGVTKGVISGNYAQDNGYAGTQVENGSESITITGNTFVNCRRGVWVDDSSHITVSGNNITGGVLGPQGVYITKEGFTGNTGYVTDNIVISGNNLSACYISSEPFGGGGGGAIGRLNITGNNIYAAGISAQSCIRLTSCSVVSIVGNTTSGGTAESISVNTQAGQITTISTNIAEAGGDGGLSCAVFSGLGERVSSLNQFPDGATLTGSQLMNNVAGTQSTSSFDGYLNARGTGSPEGVVSAPKGSTYQRLDGGAGSCFYVKESGTSNTGWVAK